MMTPTRLAEIEAAHGKMIPDKGEEAILTYAVPELAAALREAWAIIVAKDAHINILDDECVTKDSEIERLRAAGDAMAEATVKSKMQWHGVENSCAVCGSHPDDHTPTCEVAAWIAGRDE